MYDVITHLYVSIQCTDPMSIL